MRTSTVELVARTLCADLCRPLNSIPSHNTCTKDVLHDLASLCVCVCLCVLVGVSGFQCFSINPSTRMAYLNKPPYVRLIRPSTLAGIPTTQ